MKLSSGEVILMAFLIKRKVIRKIGISRENIYKGTKNQLCLREIFCLGVRHWRSPNCGQIVSLKILV